MSAKLQRPQARAEVCIHSRRQASCIVCMQASRVAMSARFGRCGDSRVVSFLSCQRGSAAAQVLADTEQHAQPSVGSLTAQRTSLTRALQQVRQSALSCRNGQRRSQQLKSLARDQLWTIERTAQYSTHRRAVCADGRAKRTTHSAPTVPAAAASTSDRLLHLSPRLSDYRRRSTRQALGVAGDAGDGTGQRQPGAQALVCPTSESATAQQQPSTRHSQPLVCSLHLTRTILPTPAAAADTAAPHCSQHTRASQQSSLC